jgi:transposase
LRNLSSVLRQLATLEEEVATIETATVQLGKALPGLTPVLQLPGLNVLSGIGLLAEIGELDWSENPKQLVAYAGLATSVRQSSERARHGKVTK